MKQKEITSSSIYIKMGVQMLACLLSVCWYVEG